MTTSIPLHVFDYLVLPQSAGDRNRTGTGITTHGILSPGRLPVPPRRRIMDGGGFEPPKHSAADLQSVPFGHSGIRPHRHYLTGQFDIIAYVHVLCKCFFKKKFSKKVFKKIKLFAAKKHLQKYYKITFRISLSFRLKY
jgi:hypothetical protein